MKKTRKKKLPYNKCYCCGDTKELNKEHCPPVCIFPHKKTRTGNIGNLNIVASCKKHNNKLSTADWNLKFILKYQHTLKRKFLMKKLKNYLIEGDI